jgi:predicted DNA-binding transcriptional regulator YafY
MAKHYFTRLEYLDYLIRLKATGTPEGLAKKLRISVRTAFGYIDLLKSLGAPIAYNKEKETYYYTENGSFHFKFQKEKSITGN